MTTSGKIIQTVNEAIDEFNEQLPQENKLEKSVDTVLFGRDGTLDSLGLVSLATTIEQKIQENHAVTMTLLQDISSLEEDNSFNTIEELAEHITSSLEKKSACILRNSDAS